MKCKSKILYIIAICFVIILTLRVNGDAVIAKDNYKGTVNLNLNRDGSNMMLDIQDADIFITDTKCEKNELSINASINYDNKNYTLNLRTELKKSITLDDVFVGNNSIDSSNNFKVVFFSIIKNSQDKNCFITKNNAVKNNNIMQLYLMRENTREFVMFELPLKLLDCESKVNYNVQKLKKVEDEHWWIKVLEPVINDKKTVRLLEPDEDDQFFSTVLYNGPGDCYKYTIELKGSSTVNSYNGQSEVTDRSYLKMVDQKYYYNDHEYDDTFLGVYNCYAQPVLSSDNIKPIDTIRNFTWGHKVHTNEGGLSVSPGLWIGKIAGAGIEWEPYTSKIDESGHENFDDDDNVKGTQLTMKKALLEKDDKYSISITKKNEGYQAGKTSGFIYTFDIGFSKNSILDSGSITVAGSYE